MNTISQLLNKTIAKHEKQYDSKKGMEQKYSICEHAKTERIEYGGMIHIVCADCRETQRKEEII
mgnify:CR=1 FL=1